MWSSCEKPGEHVEDGLDQFFLTLDEADIEPHPLDMGGTYTEPDNPERPEDWRPAPLFPNLVVLRAFWELNGFRDGNGGAIMPAVIEWWIEKERAELIAEQIRDIRDLVPVADQHWRGLQAKKFQTELPNKEG